MGGFLHLTPGLDFAHAQVLFFPFPNRVNGSELSTQQFVHVLGQFSFTPPTLLHLHAVDLFETHPAQVFCFVHESGLVAANSSVLSTHVPVGFGFEVGTNVGNAVGEGVGLEVGTNVGKAVGEGVMTPPFGLSVPVQASRGNLETLSIISSVIDVVSIGGSGCRGFRLSTISTSPTSSPNCFGASRNVTWSSHQASGFAASESFEQLS